MKITIFGPPGSGKGTQARKLCQHYGMVHISTGMLLREAVESDSELGRLVRQVIENGDLVSDEIVNQEVFRRISGLDSFLLDGYPRNVSQAEKLDEFLESRGTCLSGALLIDVPDEEVIARLAGRLECSCGRPADKGTAEGDLCPVCGTPYTRRSDDDVEVIRKRLENYHEQTEGLIGYYARDGRLARVDGVGTVECVYERILEALREWE